jgi:hypothetical protein
MLSEVISDDSLVVRVLAYRRKRKPERPPQRELPIHNNPQLAVTDTLHVPLHDCLLQSKAKLGPRKL